MTQVILGRTGLTVNKNGFGALPIQRVSRDEAAYLLQKALDNGMDYFDTARVYTDSEEKIGYALSARRGQFVLATKTMSADVEGFWNNLHKSLKKLNTDTRIPMAAILKIRSTFMRDSPLLLFQAVQPYAPFYE